MRKPTFTRERKAIAKGLIVCGIDEVGRGPLAGPVVAAAVILDPKRIPKGLNDSKVLTEARRDMLFGSIMQSAQIGIGTVDVVTIDRINILQATYRAMALALSELVSQPDLALVDGNRAPPLSCSVETIIGGDGKCISIAAASIIAKVTRDRMMTDLDGAYPGYGFASHKGYGTEDHLAALAKLGPCPAHRRSFAPLRLQIESTDAARQMNLAI
jgi:ribonuclease HII